MYFFIYAYILSGKKNQGKFGLKCFFYFDSRLVPVSTTEYYIQLK